jgi:hypothetical protein
MTFVDWVKIIFTFIMTYEFITKIIDSENRSWKDTIMVFVKYMLFVIMVVEGAFF